MRRLLRQYLPDRDTIHRNPWLRPFENSLLHPRLWQLNRRSAAGAVAAGLVCGLIPGPLQMPGAALCALLFRINLPLALVTTLYTNPVTIVPLYLLAYQLGRWLLGEQGELLLPPAFDAAQFVAWTQGMQDWMLATAHPLAVGLLLLATVLGAIGFFTVHIAWRLNLLRQQRRRRSSRSA